MYSEHLMYPSSSDSVLLGLGIRPCYYNFQHKTHTLYLCQFLKHKASLRAPSSLHLPGHLNAVLQWAYQLHWQLMKLSNVTKDCINILQGKERILLWPVSSGTFFSSIQIRTYYIVAHVPVWLKLIIKWSMQPLHVWEENKSLNDREPIRR
jgi:hypothetical protein